MLKNNRRYLIESEKNNSNQVITQKNISDNVEQILCNQNNCDLLSELKEKNTELMKLKKIMLRQLQTLKKVSDTLNEKNTELEKLSNIDELIGIANRRKFNEAFKNEINRCKRTNNTFSLIVIDIDHFKSINDNFGHTTGDIVLQKISNSISGIIRKSDTFARYGGEEFIALLPETNISGCIKFAEKIRKTIQEIDLGNKFIKNGKKISITVSQGACQYNGEDTSDAVFKKADEVLYFAKENGRNRVCVHES